ncbi:Chaperone protein DnaK [Rubripirellula tenax]|uniref:Chaperone protein DnaK n=1 Tax=Rubripirellula tenax TaxID=2528015 RepID=A0A5C6FET9_9BACT|nr:Hsp70 family protein [Rubripirellula tenax]TWU59237.1 Chaperone protein DnaK [Rubripirellula tenax]
MSKGFKPLAVGIDLGTTFSAVACLDDSGRPRTIQNAEGSLTTPSAVFLDRSGPVVGAEAIEAGMLEPERLALFAKRDVGEVAFRNKVLGHSLPPEVLEALVLKKLKEDAELVIGPFEKAVVTVPAFFNEPCRKATQDAGRLAGLDVIDIINEPTAAAITYGVGQGFLTPQGGSRELERVLVYDLGGGTFDVTVMEIDGRDFNTVATAGDVYLGGVDWDRRIVDFIAEAFVKEHGVDPRQNVFGQQELMQKANQVKHALTQRESFIIGFNFEGMRLRTELSQSVYAKMTEDLVERTLLTTRIAMDEAKLDFKQLTRLLLVGGSTRMPMIQSELEHLSGLKVDRSLSPDEAICHGAAIYAGVRLNHDASAFAGVSVTNVNSHDLGVLAVDPMTGQPRRKIMIARNSPLPASMSVRFRTHKKNQPNVKIQVVEGGDDLGTNATMVGKCYVDPLPPDTPKGTDIVVRFDYAQDGRLTVGASLPKLNCQATTLLQRGQGLNAELFELWARRIANGLDDLGTDVATPTSNDQPSEASPADSDDYENDAPVIVTAAKSTKAASGPSPRKKLKRVTRKAGDSNRVAKKTATSIEIDAEEKTAPNIKAPPTIDTSDWKNRRRGIS